MQIISRMLILLCSVIVMSFYIIEISAHAEDFNSMVTAKISSITLTQYQEKRALIRLYDSFGQNIGSLENRSDGIYFNDGENTVKLNQ